MGQEADPWGNTYYQHLYTELEQVTQWRVLDLPQTTVPRYMILVIHGFQLHHKRIEISTHPNGHLADITKRNLSLELFWQLSLKLGISELLWLAASTWSTASFFYFLILIFYGFWANDLVIQFYYWKIDLSVRLFVWEIYDIVLVSSITDLGSEFLP